MAFKTKTNFQNGKIHENANIFTSGVYIHKLFEKYIWQYLDSSAMTL